MRIMTLAAGLATGYVLGTRAGRQKYDQIAAVARRVSGNPSTQAVVDPPRQPVAAVADTKPRRPRNRRTKTAATSAAELSLDTLPLEAAEADAVEQNMPAVDKREEPATTPLPLEADADDVREQRRSL